MEPQLSSQDNNSVAVSTTTGDRASINGIQKNETLQVTGCEIIDSNNPVVVGVLSSQKHPQHVQQGQPTGAFAESQISTMTPTLSPQRSDKITSTPQVVSLIPGTNGALIATKKGRFRVIEESRISPVPGSVAGNTKQLSKQVSTLSDSSPTPQQQSQHTPSTTTNNVTESTTMPMQPTLTLPTVTTEKKGRFIISSSADEATMEQILSKANKQQLHHRSLTAGASAADTVSTAPFTQSSHHNSSTSQSSSSKQALPLPPPIHPGNTPRSKPESNKVHHSNTHTVHHTRSLSDTAAAESNHTSTTHTSSKASLFGTVPGGMGKLLHFLDQMKIETLEADKMIKTLQSDNKFLRGRNKELESKLNDTEKRLSDEKKLRESTEAKVRSLKKQITELTEQINYYISCSDEPENRSNTVMKHNTHLDTTTSSSSSNNNQHPIVTTITELQGNDRSSHRSSSSSTNPFNNTTCYPESTVIDAPQVLDLTSSLNTIGSLESLYGSDIPDFEGVDLDRKRGSIVSELSLDMMFDCTNTSQTATAARTDSGIKNHLHNHQQQQYQQQQQQVVVDSSKDVSSAQPIHNENIAHMQFDPFAK